MPITPNAAGFYASVGSVVNHDLTYTVAPGDNWLRLVVSGAAIPTITAMTWDQGGTNQALTALTAVLTNADGRLMREYTRATPTVGTKTMRVQLSAPAGEIFYGIQSFAGVNLGAPTSGLQSFTTGGPGDTSPTNLPSIVSAAGDLVLSALVLPFTLTCAAADGQVEDLNANEVLIGVCRMGMSHIAGAALTPTNWTFSGGATNYVILGYSLAAATAAGGGGYQVPQVVGEAWERFPGPCLGRVWG